MKETMQFDRRLILGGIATSSVFGFALPADAAELTSDKLERLIDTALDEPDTTPLSRPALLGLGDQKLTTKSIERGDNVHKYGFMVIIPRRTDGLIMFEGSDKPLFFAIHRTGEHMRRLASVKNQDGKLVRWSGAEADTNFAKQKEFWASV